MAHGYHAIGIQNGTLSADRSAQSVLYGDTPVSFQKYANMNGISGNPYSLGNKIMDFVTGNVKSAEQAYNNYLTEFSNRKNAEITAKANQETYEREDSQVQRLLQDYQKAGLNPFALMSGGNLSGGVVSSSAQTYQHKRPEKKSDGKSSGLGTALKLLAILALKG